MSKPVPVQIAKNSIRYFHINLFKTLFYFCLFIVGLLGAYTVFPYLLDALFLIVMAIILTALLSPLIDFMQSHGIRRLYGALIFIIVFFTTIGISVVKGIPILLDEIGKIKDMIQQSASAGIFDEWMLKVNTFISEYIPDFQIDTGIVSNLSSTFFNQLGSILAGALDTFATVLFILIITMFFLVDGSRIMKRIIEAIPNRYFEMALNISYKTKKQLTNFLRGQLVAAAGVAVQSIIGLHLLNWIFDANISGPFLIGSIAGIANIIPYIGPFMGMAPAIIVSLFNNMGDPVAAANFYYIIHIVVMFFIVQLIDNNFISPLVVSGSMAMHPLTVMIVILIGSQMGVLGMFLAVPVWGILKVVVMEIYMGARRHRLI